MKYHRKRGNIAQKKCHSNEMAQRQKSKNCPLSTHLPRLRRSHSAERCSSPRLPCPPAASVSASLPVPARHPLWHLWGTASWPELPVEASVGPEPIASFPELESLRETRPRVRTAPRRGQVSTSFQTFRFKFRERFLLSFLNDRWRAFSLLLLYPEPMSWTNFSLA